MIICYIPTLNLRSTHRTFDVFQSAVHDLRKRESNLSHVRVTCRYVLTRRLTGMFYSRRGRIGRDRFRVTFGLSCYYYDDAIIETSVGRRPRYARRSNRISIRQIIAPRLKSGYGPIHVLHATTTTRRDGAGWRELTIPKRRRRASRAWCTSMPNPCEIRYGSPASTPSRGITPCPIPEII